MEEKEEITLNFSNYLKQVIDRLKEVSNISLDGNDYDAVLVKSLPKSNLIDKNRNSKQSHIALTGNSRDIFPYIDTYRYTEDMSNNSLYKSFYVLQVPFNLYKSNMEYGGMNSLDIPSEIVTTNVSVKLSRPKEKQIELGNTTQSDKFFKEFRKLFESKDVIVILKRNLEFLYDAFILKEKDLKNLKPTTVLKPQGKNNSTFISVNSYTREDDVSQAVFTGAENVIFYGAPGTGKSHDLVNYINEEDSSYEYTNENLQDTENVFRVTLHPEYEYSDFVGQLLPQNDGSFAYNKGGFTLALQYAEDNTQKPVFMILEEMSRANVAAVFGDLFQLLDRKEDGTSEYYINNKMLAEMVYGLKDNAAERKKIIIPSNLYIIGTVNTSDQNVFVMDTAFKRRFRWVYKSTNIKNINKFENNPKINLYDDVKITWYEFYTILNNFIVTELDMKEDKQIGPYFIKFDMSDNPKKTAHELIKDKLLQYLWEDVENIARNSFTNNNKTIFNDNIKSFSELYTKFENNQNVFSKALNEKLSLDTVATKNQGEKANASTIED